VIYKVESGAVQTALSGESSAAYQNQSGEIVSDQAMAFVSSGSMAGNVGVISAETTAVVYAGDYLNKLTGESVERECRRKIAEGATQLVVNFSKTELVNSIGVSILLGVIDAAKTNGASVTFADVNEDTAELFEMLGLTKHVRLVHGQ